MAENINTANLNTSASVTADNHSSPWTRNIRRESEPPIVGNPLSAPSMALIEPPVVEEEDEGDENTSSWPNGNAGKRIAWNKPSNAADIGPVMGTNKWPALSAKVPSKLSPDSPRALFDGSSSFVVPVVSKGSGSASSSSTPQKLVSNSANANSSLITNHIAPTRQRSMKRNSNNSASNGGLSQPPPQGPVVESPISSPSSRDNIQRSGFVSQSHTGGNDHPNPRNSFRYRNGGMHPRGDGSHNQNFGGRRNQDPGNHEWTGRNFNIRDGLMQPRSVPRLMRHPPPPPLVNTIPFIAPTPMRPFGTPMGYPELGSFYIVPSPDSLRTFPFVGPMPPAYFQAPEPHDNQLHASIVNQIDYYFSDENLIKDTYLRQNMDDQGWVPIKLIAGFKKVSLLTDNIQLIVDALQSSTVVEVQGDKLRKRIDWMRWIMSPSVQFPAISGQDKLVDRVQNISLEQKTTNQSRARSQDDSNAGGVSGRASFGDLNNHYSEVTAVGAQGGPASN